MLVNLKNPRSKLVNGRYLYCIAPGRWVTRQCLHIYRRQALGLCVACGGNTKAVTGRYCERHRRKINAWQNARNAASHARRLCALCHRRSDGYWYCRQHRREAAAYLRTWRADRKARA